jgi:DnaJ-class molecular chaperone
MNYEIFQKALETLGVISGMGKKEIRERYLSLSKQHHPDRQGGQSHKFQEIHEAYTLLMEYTEQFRFRFSQTEFQEQFPFCDAYKNDWHKI